MKYIVNDQVVLSRSLGGPLAAYVKGFARWSSEQGYAVYTLRRRVRIAADFSRWLAKKRVRRQGISSKHPAQYLRARARRVPIREGDPAALTHFLGFLRSEGVIPAEKIGRRRLTPAEQCALAFEQHLRDERDLAQVTIVHYLRFIRDFLKDRFGNGPAPLSRLSARDVVHFVQRRAPCLGLKRAKLLTTALRSFLKFARYCGDVQLDLAAAVPTVANWSMTAIPRAIAPDQVHRLLARIERRTVVGRRDYAVLLLLARLGLRAGEVMSLDLDDVNWGAGTVTVHGKGGRQSEFPLPADVGAAIAGYLQNGRPTSTCRRLFLRARAPNLGLRGPSTVGCIVRRAILRYGIEAPTYGAHQFRHGFATDLLRHGASLGEIGELLGHRHPDTTKIYTKVDLQALRTLAVPWPGGVR
jgi:site-specific recombinase XerD